MGLFALSLPHRYNAEEFVTGKQEQDVPRKYHRPPTAKRRKPKKSTTSPYVLEQPPEPDNGDAPAVSAEEQEEEALAKAAAPAVRAREESRAVASRSPGAAPAKHVSRDYSYVRGEILRIVAVAGFLVIALVITAVLRG